jgi:hypothetical protein
MPTDRKAHPAILQLITALHYFDVDLEGVCKGFSLKWMEAALLGEKEQKRFNDRIDKICSTGILLH